MRWSMIAVIGYKHAMIQPDLPFKAKMSTVPDLGHKYSQSRSYLNPKELSKFAVDILNIFFLFFKEK